MDTTRTCRELLEEYRQTNSSRNSRKLKFLLDEEDDRDVYNISAPFILKGERFLAGRAEARDSEDSEILFFLETEDGWRMDKRFRPLRLQDPFLTMVGEELILGGVEVYSDPEQPDRPAWRTQFYRGASLGDLKPFAKGPDRMKDIRLKELPDGRIFVTTRPQGLTGGRGKIGITIIDCLEDLDETHINEARLLNHMFTSEEWGGANELHLLKNGAIGVLGHIACYDEEGNRHYYAAAFAYDLKTCAHTPMKLIAERADFKEGPAKRPDLKDVVFGGGLIRRGDGTAELYCGVSDAEAHVCVIPDPFTEWETKTNH